MTKLYLAGKLNNAETSLGGFAAELEDRGHAITLKWWELPKLPTPYLANPVTSAPAAEDMVNAVLDADVCVLFPEDNILGAMGEFAIALGDKVTTRPDKEVIVVSPFEKRQSVFYAHPGVLAVASLTEVRQRPWY